MFTPCGGNGKGRRSPRKLITDKTIQPQASVNTIQHDPAGWRRLSSPSAPRSQSILRVNERRRAARGRAGVCRFVFRAAPCRAMLTHQSEAPPGRVALSPAASNRRACFRNPDLSSPGPTGSDLVLKQQVLFQVLFLHALHSGGRFDGKRQNYEDLPPAATGANSSTTEFLKADVLLVHGKVPPCEPFSCVSSGSSRAALPWK